MTGIPDPNPCQIRQDGDSLLAAACAKHPDTQLVLVGTGLLQCNCPHLECES